MSDEIFFFFFCRELHNWTESKTGGGWRDTLWITRTLYVVFLTFYRPSLCSFTGLCQWWHSDQIIQLAQYRTTLDCCLRHLKRWQITWHWPLRGLNDVCHVWLSAYKCVTTHFHHSDLRIKACCHINCCKLPIPHSHFIRKTRSQGYCRLRNGLTGTYSQLYRCLSHSNV